MFFLWREAAALDFIVTLLATASQMDACAPPAIVLVHMVAGVYRRVITLRRPQGMGRLLGMGRPPRRRPAAIPDTLHRKILLRGRQEATRLRPDLKRVHLQASKWVRTKRRKPVRNAKVESRATPRFGQSSNAWRISRAMSAAWASEKPNHRNRCL
jgi:hypothetical protein